jgi:NADPH:quinone reductase-like Zn-dependent oxidoreductase
LYISRIRCDALVAAALAKLNQKDLTAIGALMEEGKVTPVIDRRYSLGEVAEAVLYVEEGTHAER